MTVLWTVRAALTEERSKGEIKSSALRCRDERSPLTRTKKALKTLRFQGFFLLYFYCFRTALMQQHHDGRRWGIDRTPPESYE